MIQTFGDKETERLFHREPVKKFLQSVQRSTGNRLEKLRGRIEARLGTVVLVDPDGNLIEGDAESLAKIRREVG